MSFLRRVLAARVDQTDLPAGLERVAVRRLLHEAPVVRLALHPGDRALVEAGQAIQVGGPLIERARAATAVEVDPADVPGEARSGDWWVAPGRRHGLRRGRPGVTAGELLYRAQDGWVAVAGDRTDVVEAPVAGIVREVSAGIGISIATGSIGIAAVAIAGGPSRGRLEVAAPADGELRTGALDIRRAGAVVAVGSRVGPEAITRARAMGIRGLIAGGVATRDLRELAASEARQRASLQSVPAFATLALEGHVRAPIASPVATILAAIAGRDVALVGEPPFLLVDGLTAPPPMPPADLVRVRSGPGIGTEGRWGGLAGRRRFDAGVHLEAGLVEVEGSGTIVVPLADLERFG